MSEAHFISVSKTARYHTIGDLHDAREVWFVLHGYAQLAGRFIRRFASLDAVDRLIVAPEALNRYYFETAPGVHAQDAGIGATWMTREDREHEITDYVAYLDTLYDTIIGGLSQPPSRIVALGFSQGGATAARWIERGSARVTDLILCGAFLPPELDVRSGALKGAALSLMHGSEDRYASSERIAKESERLNEAGVVHRVTAFDGGHEINESAIRALLES
jgi:predicted esterase